MNLGAHGNPGAADLVLLVAVASLPIPEVILFPALRRALAEGSTTARLAFYRTVTVVEWLFAGAVALLWIANGRPWSALLLGSAAPWRVALCFLLIPVAVWIWLSNQRAVDRAGPEQLERLRMRAGGALFILPNTASERDVFRFVSLTAGICEEIVYRGFVMWALASYVGLYPALALQAVIFALGHVYQGSDPRSIASALLKTGAAGLFFGLIALAAGSLIPGMIVHTLMDLSSGEVSYRFFAKESSAAT